MNCDMCHRSICCARKTRYDKKWVCDNCWAMRYGLDCESCGHTFLPGTWEEADRGACVECQLDKALYGLLA